MNTNTHHMKSHNNNSIRIKYNYDGTNNIIGQNKYSNLKLLTYNSTKITHNTMELPTSISNNTHKYKHLYDYQNNPIYEIIKNSIIYHMNI